MTKQVSSSVAPRRREGSYWFYLVPGTIGFVAVVAIPLGMNGYFSLTRWSGVGTPEFIGWDNYTRLAADPLFWGSFANSLAFVLGMAVIPTAIGVLVAAILFDFISPRFGARVASFLRATYYLPQILPIAAAGVLWKWMYQPDYGVINAILKTIGLGQFASNWLGDPSVALFAVMNVLIWLQLGYTVVIFMAGMARVDPALYEAAEMDGASWIRRFRVITLTQLRPEIAIVLVTTTVAALKVFAPVYILTKGGPGTSTVVPAYFSYSNFFTTSQVGYGAAISSVLAVVVTVVAIVMLKLQNRAAEEAGR
ncbi:MULTISPECIES: carbohydrate ABC transporter permease [unclassified Microbacterium]|uniref:carbohydrate ABC transporter permease n=1 Tax=unclassified Microbacterium TaxID=2609290 RepID=UPI003653E2F7